ncbi:hypothetical protein Ssi02_11070 [Sinosporangium siamense]|uniref:Uncharacterized protein n=1 Tax=Sinosporangium siamense TaxID=1367973 RepID=A0A919RBG7_9ACTN|nr:hypothetical protein Ssi02_11070 [Sinosporangium siamense]
MGILQRKAYAYSARSPRLKSTVKRPVRWKTTKEPLHIIVVDGTLYQSDAVVIKEPPATPSGPEASTPRLPNPRSLSRTTCMPRRTTGDAALASHRSIGLPYSPH